jgi:hypothetical protein
VGKMVDAHDQWVVVACRFHFLRGYDVANPTQREGEGGKKKNGRKEGTRWVCIHERESSPAAIVYRARFRREKFEGRRQQRLQSSQHNPPKAKCATLSHSSTLSLSFAITPARGRE